MTAVVGAAGDEPTVLGPPDAGDVGPCEGGHDVCVVGSDCCFLLPS